MELKLSPRDQIIAVGIGALLILVLTVFLVLKPQFGLISELKTEQEAENAKLEEAKLKLQRLDAIRQEASEIEAKRISLSRRLPDDAELPTLVVELQKIANSSGLDFGAVQIEAVAEQPGYAQIPLTINVTGTFYSIVDYLYRLEKMTREIVVDSFDIQPTAYPELGINISAHVFKLTKSAAPQLPPPAPAPAAGEPPAGTGVQ